MGDNSFDNHISFGIQTPLKSLSLLMITFLQAKGIPCDYLLQFSGDNTLNNNADFISSVVIIYVRGFIELLSVRARN